MPEHHPVDLNLTPEKFEPSTPPVETDAATLKTRVAFGGFTRQDSDWHLNYDAATPLFKSHVHLGVEAMLEQFRTLGYVTKGDDRLEKLMAAVARYLMESQQ